MQLLLLPRSSLDQRFHHWMSQEPRGVLVTTNGQLYTIAYIHRNHEGVHQIDVITQYLEHGSPEFVTSHFLGSSTKMIKNKMKGLLAYQKVCCILLSVSAHC